MMIHKRLLAMVPESKPWMVRKVAVNWLSLAAAGTGPGTAEKQSRLYL